MYTSNMGYMNLGSANSIAIAGTRRHVLYNNHKYGISVGDFNSHVQFGFVVYKPSQFNPDPIRIELKLLVRENEDISSWRLDDIDPNFLQGLLDSIEDERDPIKYTYHIENGHGFFKGYYLRGCPKDVPQAIQSSNAARFLDVWGDALATAIYAKGKVSTLPDAYEVNDLLISVNAFSHEMSEKPEWGTATNNIDCARKKYEGFKNDLVKVENEMNHFYKQLAEYLQVLEKYGVSEDVIDYKS